MTERGPRPSPSRFEQAYEGTPPWDIGRPQRAMVELVAAGGLSGSVLEVGCGTGEHTLLAAEHGHEAWGIDLVPRAIEQARAKAEARGLAATFRVHDALDLGTLGRSFDTVLDVGVFHVFDDADRARYVESLGQVLEEGGRYHMLVFSDREPTDWGGPRRIAREEIVQAFREGWQVEAIEPAIFEGWLRGEAISTGEAWRASLRRTL